MAISNLDKKLQIRVHDKIYSKIKSYEDKTSIVTSTLVRALINIGLKELEGLSLKHLVEKISKNK